MCEALFSLGSVGAEVVESEVAWGSLAMDPLKLLSCPTLSTVHAA